MSQLSTCKLLGFLAFFVSAVSVVRTSFGNLSPHSQLSHLPVLRDFHESREATREGFRGCLPLPAGGWRSQMFHSRPGIGGFKQEEDLMRVRKRLFSSLAIAAMFATGVIGTVPSASATGYNCRTLVSGQGGQSQCMYLWGNGTHVDTSKEQGHQLSTYICSYSGKWYGNYRTGGWKNIISAVSPGCVYEHAWTGLYHPYATYGGNVPGSAFWGFWRSSNTGNLWSAGAVLIVG